MLSAVSYWNACDLRISATGGLKIRRLAPGCFGAIVWAAVVSRIFVGVQIVVAFTIRSPGVGPAECDFDRGARVSGRITCGQIRGQREVVARLGRIIAF